jgi:hypothetical protein
VNPEPVDNRRASRPKLVIELGRRVPDADLAQIHAFIAESLLLQVSAEIQSGALLGTAVPFPTAHEYPLMVSTYSTEVNGWYGGRTTVVLRVVFYQQNGRYVIVRVLISDPRPLKRTTGIPRQVFKLIIPLVGG